MGKINFLKTRDVISPSRAFETDAGIDFFVPVFNKKFVDYLLEKNPKTFKAPTLTSLCISASGMCGTTTYGTDYSSALPPEEKWFGFDIEVGKPYFILDPEKGVKIPSGIRVRMEEPGRMLRAANKSGLSTETLLDVTAEIVDYGYTGEIHIAVKNDSDVPVKIYQDQKIIQFIEMPIFNSQIEVLSAIKEDGLDKIINEFYKDRKTERGAGGFGSTGSGHTSSAGF